MRCARSRVGRCAVPCTARGAAVPGSPGALRSAAGRPLRPSRRWLPAPRAPPAYAPPPVHPCAPRARTMRRGVSHLAVTLGDTGSCPLRGRDHPSHRSLADPQAARRADAGHCGALRGRTALGRVPRRMAGARRRDAALLVRCRRLRSARRAPHRPRLGRTGQRQRHRRPPDVEQAAVYKRRAGRSRRWMSRRPQAAWPWPVWSGWPCRSAR